LGSGLGYVHPSQPQAFLKLFLMGGGRYDYGSISNGKCTANETTQNVD
jgi:hypothetical protein